MLCNTLPLIISRHNSFLIAALQLQQKTLSTFHLNYLSTWHAGEGGVGEMGVRGWISGEFFLYNGGSHLISMENN